MSFFSKLLEYVVPKSNTSEPKFTFESQDHDIVVARNEVGEQIILYIPKRYKEFYRN